MVARMDSGNFEGMLKNFCESSYRMDSSRTVD